MRYQTVVWIFVDQLIRLSIIPTYLICRVPVCTRHKRAMGEPEHLEPEDNHSGSETREGNRSELGRACNWPRLPIYHCLLTYL